MISRLSIYFAEQGRPIFVLMLSALTSLAVLGMYEAAIGEKALTIGPTLVVTISTYFLIFLHWRVADEFKDRETDRRFFPDRPVPSGRVRLTDLRALLIAITLLVFVINAVWRTAFVPFLVVFVYALLMSRWFFLERYLAPNRFMAVLTHSPTFVLLNIYVIAWYAKQQGQPILSTESLVITAWFVLHVLSWEFARKAWAPSQEMPGYQTYSSSLGYRRAGLLPLVFVLSQWLLLAWICARFDLSRWILLATGIPMLAFADACIRYALFPERYAARLNRVAPLYLLSIPFAVTLYFAVFGGIRVAG
jgi:4-hydroxybenzoate polyprenyltransferase